MRGLNKMIFYSTILEAKKGNDEAIFKILDYYMNKAKKISTDEDFIQMALYEVLLGIKNFKNIRK